LNKKWQKFQELKREPDRKGIIKNLEVKEGEELKNHRHKSVKEGVKRDFKSLHSRLLKTFY
jgi:hypothetical protein